MPLWVCPTSLKLAGRRVQLCIALPPASVNACRLVQAAGMVPLQIKVMFSGGLNARATLSNVPFTVFAIRLCDVLTTLMAHSLKTVILSSGISLFTKKVLNSGVAEVPIWKVPPAIDFNLPLSI